MVITCIGNEDMSEVFVHKFIVAQSWTLRSKLIKNVFPYFEIDSIIMVYALFQRYFVKVSLDLCSGLSFRKQLYFKKAIDPLNT